MSIVALAAKRCQPTSPNSIVAWSPEEEVAAATPLRKELSLARSHQCRRLFVEREKRVSAGAPGAFGPRGGPRAPRGDDGRTG